MEALQIVAFALGNVLSSGRSPHWEGSSLCPCSVPAPTRVHVCHCVPGCHGHQVGCRSWAVCPLLFPAHLSPPAVLVGPSHPLASVSGGHISTFMSD